MASCREIRRSWDPIHWTGVHAIIGGFCNAFRELDEQAILELEQGNTTAATKGSIGATDGWDIETAGGPSDEPIGFRQA